MGNRLLSRVQSAIINGEDPVLDQLYSDINQTMLLGSINTPQYDMTFSEGHVEIHDKVHDEYAMAYSMDNEIILSKA
jgi:hypothetical protein